MRKLQEIIAYLCKNYPHKQELSKARLTKLVYLADWFSAVSRKKQMSDITWLFNHYGPYVDDVIDSIRHDSNFSIAKDQNAYGSEKSVIIYKGNCEFKKLDSSDIRILDAIIEKTKTMYFNDFINYVYSTYPVRSKERYSSLDLVELAKKMDLEQ
ncbi:Panacea domain-containing protein [Pseudomonas oryzihabitans]|uniref:Panacea domain-containing protein n=1 Tax=Pseudomonas oryzihabitans TaxID=47885 RepID=UPI00119EF300